MKKNLLAASLALALGSMSGVASAALEVNHNGVGQINVLPYYSVQDSYNTLMTITNTDAVNGKVVKIRFRAAEWSDDALDFQIFMSPNDVWTGAFGIVDGKLVLKTNDKTCSLPAALDGQEFTSIRVEGRNVDSLKEGYVEIITMADIPPKAQNVTADRASYAPSSIDNPLFTAIEHDDGVAACGSILTGLVEDSLRSPANDEAVTVTDLNVNAEQVTWMKPASASLTSSATIIAVSDSKAFTVPGVALRGDVGAGAGAESFTQVQYYRQANAPFTPDAPANNAATVKAVDNLTMDRLFWPKSADGTGYTVFQFDLPDLSTPFNAVETARQRRNEIAGLLAKSTVASDYVISQSIKASTDVLFSQPVRRYFYVYDDTVAADAVFGTGYNRTISGTKYLVGGEASTVYAALTPSNKIEIGGPTFYDREERTFVPETDIVVSPQEPGEEAAFFLEGEVSVVSIKKNGDAAAPTGALGARLTNVDWGFTQDYDAGWAKIDTRTVDAAGNPISGLPLVGFTAINIFNQSAGAAGTNYGQVLPLRNLAPMAP